MSKAHYSHYQCAYKYYAQFKNYPDYGGLLKKFFVSLCTNFKLEKVVYVSHAFSVQSTSRAYNEVKQVISR